MTNPYYNKTFDVMPGTRIDSPTLEAQFLSVEQGFDGVKTAVDAKAPTASPAFTGSPTAPTQAVSDDSTKLATTEFVKDVFATVPAGALPATAGKARQGLRVTADESGVEWGSNPAGDIYLATNFGAL